MSEGVKIFIGLAPIGLAGLTLAKKDYQDHLSCVNQRSITNLSTLSSIHVKLFAKEQMQTLSLC